MNITRKIQRIIQSLFLPRGGWNNKRTHWIVEHCYIDMYRYSTPRGDFRELVKNAKLNESGEKDIPFNDYLIEQDKYYSILRFYQSFLKEKYYKQVLSNQIHLGCSPKIMK